VSRGGDSDGLMTMIWFPVALGVGGILGRLIAFTINVTSTFAIGPGNHEPYM
jgi:hypothetical protein